VVKNFLCRVVLLLWFVELWDANNGLSPVVFAVRWIGGGVVLLKTLVDP
jgi:hypothetical protein